MSIKDKKLNEQIGVLMKDFVTHAVDFYNNLETKPVCRPAPKETLAHLKSQTIPAHGRPIPEVYSEMLKDIYSNTMLVQHPRSFSCIPSTASLLSWMGDVMTSAYNPHASCQINAPAADLVEKQLIRWMCNSAGYPKESGGLFVSGGSIANLTALTAARDAKLPYGERGNASIYILDQTHSSVSKGLHIIGFCKEQIHIIPTDSSFCMDISALQAAIEKDIANQKKPFAVVASAGTTNTGSVDPISEISALCRKYDMWLHVDGAFGASALLSERYRKKLSGIELSDSLSWDAHKWLLQTYGCSVVLVRNQSFLAKSFAAHPEYLKDAEASEGSIEFWDLGPELTRPARGLKLWLTLQATGTDEIERIIDHGCALAELAEKIIRENPEWEIVSPAQLGIVNFRYIANGTLSENDLNKINQKISREITESGFAQIFTTELRGKKVLRMCTIHPETTEKDIHDTIEKLMESAICKTSSNPPPRWESESQLRNYA
ncbi:MAG: L-2,4-diaminobutyrate decarboxylase [Eubacteriales bacterium]